jgi:hypothetical protein
MCRPASTPPTLSAPPASGVSQRGSRLQCSRPAAASRSTAKVISSHIRMCAVRSCNESQKCPKKPAVTRYGARSSASVSPSIRSRNS